MMDDKAKEVIEKLEACLPPKFIKNEDMPFDIRIMVEEYVANRITANLIDNAITLLKDKTPLEPVAMSCTTTEHSNSAITKRITTTFVCGDCDGAMLRSYNYCPYCGRPIDWNAYYERIKTNWQDVERIT